MLSPKQARFVSEYLKGTTGEEAAIKAGYPAHSARSMASHLLTRINIRTAVREGREAIAEALLLTVAEMILELRWIARSNLADAFDEYGQPKQIHKIPKQVQRCLSSYKRTKKFDKDGNEIEEVIEVKMWDKLAAIDKIARHLGMYVDQDELKKLRQDLDDLQARRRREDGE